MIRLLFILIFCFAAPVPDRPRISPEGVFKGVPLKGRVKVVTSFPTFRVKVVSHFFDLRVKKVTSSALRVGEWQFVTSFEDFSIQYVTSFPGVSSPIR